MAGEINFLGQVDSLIAANGQLLVENERLRRIHKAADAMAMAYAGEVAARAAGLPVVGFPLLAAYQRLMSLLWELEEASSVDP